MSATLPFVWARSRQWINLYTETGLPVGTQLIVQNLGRGVARLVESSAQPELTGGYNVIKGGQFLTSSVAPVGLWVYSYAGVKLQVEEA